MIVYSVTSGSLCYYDNCLIEYLQQLWTFATLNQLLYGGFHGGLVIGLNEHSLAFRGQVGMTIQ